MMRLRVSLTGPGVVGPSVMTFYGVGSPSTWRGAIVGLLQAEVGRIPDDVQMTVPNGGDELNAATGAIEGSWTSGTTSVVNGTATTGFALGVGYRIVWETNDITRGRHVRGSTFFSPAASVIYDTTGRILPASQNSIAASAQAYLTAAQGTALVWTRPKGFLAGAMRPITGFRVPENPTWLTSRRT